MTETHIINGPCMHAKQAIFVVLPEEKELIERALVLTHERKS